MSGPRDAVDEANRGFYRAFEALDLAQMDKVWAHGDHVRCVHPGWPLLSGWPAVRASWEAIFDGTGEIRFTIADEHIAVQGELAWVTCTENILSQVGGRVTVTSVLATNIFEFAPEGWLMVHHHASHVLGGSAPAEG
jgi:ketosteroid isomerase-like protein